MSNFTLCIDTSAGTTVAVLQGGEVLSEIHFDENMKHAERIGEAISQAIADAKTTPKRINSVVVGRGPAPFTGLRIGIAAAEMFAEGVGAELFGISSLDAIAHAAFQERKTAGLSESKPILVTADARRSEHYWALYSGLTKNGAPILLEGPGVAKPAALDEKFAGQDLERTTIKISAVDLGKVFDAQILDGTASHSVEAMYLREADAVAPKVLRDFGKKVSG
jgi:tRNA threonylcarbamoyl adenosine modification protein YeaZ